jgi:signal transduction histidine kinase
MEAASGRRTYVIDRGFQLKYTVMLVVLGAGISSLFAAMIYLAHQDAVRELPALPEVQDYFSRADSTLVVRMVGLTVLTAAALGLLGVLVTHRVAGPIYVMSHYVSILAKGRFPLMRPLRKGDELREFFDRFRAAVELMRSREAEEATHLEKALAALEPLAQTDEARRALGELKLICERKRDATDVVNVGR